MSKEDFLSRWSRRKREAEADAPSSEAARPVEARDAQEPPADAQAEPDIDLSSLPPIDSITAATDITAFLRKGIPQELTRAALRRAWTSDPAIRDFVGLAENAWDFNDPTAMPGFGPLEYSEAELSALVDRVVGGARRVADSLTGGDVVAEEAAQTTAAEHVVDRQTHSTVAGKGPDAVDQAASSELSRSPAALQQEIAELPEPAQRRRHGSALPQHTDDNSVRGS